MSSFFIGQRVRIKRDSFGLKLRGHEGTVVGPLLPWTEGDGYGYPVLVDGLPTDSPGHGSRVILNSIGDWGYLTPAACDLEPILRQGEEITTWAACGFHPSQFIRKSCSTQPEG